MSLSEVQANARAVIMESARKLEDQMFLKSLRACNDNEGPDGILGKAVCAAIDRGALPEELAPMLEPFFREFWLFLSLEAPQYEKTSTGPMFSPQITYEDLAAAGVYIPIVKVN